MNIAIVTGASSGMGAEFARQLHYYYDNYDEIWLIARRKERLEALAQTLDDKTRIITADLTRSSDLKYIARQLSLINPNVTQLINCAGFGIMGSFETLPLKEQSDMIDLNVKALVKLTHMVLPYMRKNANIIQLASVAAFLPQENFCVYAASKSFVLSFSRALNEELKKRKICVTAVCPGPVETEFFNIAEKYNETLAIKKLFYVKPELVVKGALAASVKRKAYFTPTLPMKAIQIMSKIIPHSFILNGQKILNTVTSINKEVIMSKLLSRRQS